jgi:phosphate transport system substrate-binding protein
MEQPQSHNLEKPLGGRYKIVQQFGAGGFSQTFLAEDLHLPNHPRCVVKQLKPHFDSDEDWETARRLFNTEAQVLYTLGNHDQIPRLLAHFEEDQKFYLAQELIVGESLDKLLVNKLVWTQAEVVALLRDLLRVLAFVHEKGVIHRDIKPSNLIWRQQDGKIVLIDFGAVKQVRSGVGEAKSGKTDLTVSIGTQGYTPNEQLAGEPCFSSDVYAVGMVAIRALTGIRPKSLKRDPRTREFQWADEGISICPELAAVLNRMVCYDFRERYSTAQEALEALTNISAYLPEWSLEPSTISELDHSSLQSDAQTSRTFRQPPDNISVELAPTEPQIPAKITLKRLVPLGGLVAAGVAILMVNSLLSSQFFSAWFNQDLDQGSVPSTQGGQNNSIPPSNGGTLTGEPSSSPINFGAVPNVPTGLFNYGGSIIWAPIQDSVDSVIQAAHPEFQLRYTPPVNDSPDSGTSIRMLLEGQLAFVQSSRPLEDQEYQQAQFQGFSLKQIPVGIDGIAIAVHPSLSIPGLNLQQLQDIYTGKITNWQQIGGPDLEITLYSGRPGNSGTVEFFVKDVLANTSLGSQVQYVYDTTDGLQRLANDPGGIYYASAPEVIPQCGVKALPIAREDNNFVSPYQDPVVPPDRCPQEQNQLNANAFKTGEYPITRQLFVIIKEDGQIDQQAGEAYANLLLTNEGQELISNAGFVRIR